MEKSIFACFEFGVFIKVIICKSAHWLNLADAIGRHDWKATNGDPRKKRTSTRSSLSDAGHTQRSRVHVCVHRINGTFLIIDRFGIYWLKNICIFHVCCPIFKSPPRSCCRTKAIVIYSVSAIPITHVCKYKCSFTDLQLFSQFKFNSFGL